MWKRIMPAVSSSIPRSAAAQGDLFGEAQMVNLLRYSGRRVWYIPQSAPYARALHGRCSRSVDLNQTKGAHVEPGLAGAGAKLADQFDTLLVAVHRKFNLEFCPGRVTSKICRRL